MKKAIIGILLAVVIIAAVVLLFVLPNRQFKAALDGGLAQLKANESLEIESIGYKSAGYSLFGGRATVEGLTVKFKPEATLTEFNVESIQGSGVPLKLVVSLMRGDSDPFIRGFKAFDELEIKNFNYKLDDGRSIMEYTQSSSKIKGVSFNPGRAIPDIKQNSAEFFTWLVSNLRFDSSEEQGLEITFAMSGENSKLVFKMGQGGSTNYDALKIGKVFAKDCSLNADLPKKSSVDSGVHHLQVKLDGFSATNLDFSKIALLLATAAGKDDDALNQRLQNTNLLLPAYGYDQIEMEPLEVKIDNKTVFKIERIVNAGPVVPSRFPARVTSSVTGMVIDWSQWAGFLDEDELSRSSFWETMKDMGYNESKIDVSAEMLYSETDRTFEVKQYVFDVADVFKIDFSFKLANVNVGDENTDSRSALMGLISLALDNVQITLTDQGFASRFKSYLSRQELGLEDQEALNAMILQIIDQMTPKAEQLLENPVPVLAEIKAFVNDTRKISLASGHTAPLSIFAWAGGSSSDPAAILNPLQPVLTVNERAPVSIVFLNKGKSTPDSFLQDNGYDDN